MVWPGVAAHEYSAIMYYTGEYSNGRAPIMIGSYRCYGVKKSCIQTYELMDERTDERNIETIIFDQGVRKYVRVNDYDLWPGFNVTDHNYNWPLFRVGLLRVIDPVLVNTSTF